MVHTVAGTLVKTSRVRLSKVVNTVTVTRRRAYLDRACIRRQTSSGCCRLSIPVPGGRSSKTLWNYISSQPSPYARYGFPSQDSEPRQRRRRGRQEGTSERERELEVEDQRPWLDLQLFHTTHPSHDPHRSRNSFFRGKRISGSLATGVWWDSAVHTTRCLRLLPFLFPGPSQFQAAGQKHDPAAARLGILVLDGIVG